MNHEGVPAWLVRWGGIAWRLVAIGLVVFFGFRALRTVSVVILAVVVAAFFAAVLWRPNDWLVSRGLPPTVAGIAVLTGAVAALVGLIALISSQIAASFDNLSEDVGEAADSFQEWLINGPLGLTQAEIDDYWESITEWIQTAGSDSLLGGATVALEVITGFFLAVIVTFFLLKDGRRLMGALIERLPGETGGKVATGARIARKTIAHYMGGIAIVGVFDAVLIGIALWIVGTPLVFPLAVLVFLGAFIPLVGAFVSGLLAVAVTFVNGGLVDGLIILAVTVGVQQFEGDVIMPLVYGQTLKLHPLVILLGVAAGGIAFGLFGAFLAVPLIAVAVSIDESLSEDPEATYLSLARG
jgi:predicted PurR-regulated permease PerM